MKTFRDELERLSETETTTEKDDSIIQYLMARLDIDGKCTSGLVYIKPYGMRPPISISAFCKSLLSALKSS